MPNAVRGEVELPGLGVIRFNHDALARVRDVLGPEWDKVLSDAMLTHDMETIDKVVAIGLGKSFEEVWAFSPPVVPTIEAVMVALNLAFHGQREAPRDADENPPVLQGIISRMRSVLHTGLV